MIKAELSHYSNGTTDIEFLFPFGWGELWGIADRTNYDLGRHQEASGKSLEYFDPETNEHYHPLCHRALAGRRPRGPCFPVEAYDEEVVDARKNRHPRGDAPAPGAGPLQGRRASAFKKAGEKAREIYTGLAKYFMVDYDEAGSIGKRYRRQDEVGTPLCITVDFQTVRRSAPPLPTTASPCGTATPWSRCASPSNSFAAILRKKPHFKLSPAAGGPRCAFTARAAFPFICSSLYLLREAHAPLPAQTVGQGHHMATGLMRISGTRTGPVQ